MSTEDDTFNILRKLPFTQLKELIASSNGSKSTEEICIRHGWGYQEYLTEKILRTIQQIRQRQWK